MSESDSGRDAGAPDSAEDDEQSSEAEGLGGRSAALRVAEKRTRAYTKADWIRMYEEQKAILAAAFAALQAGHAADSEEAMRIAERHRRFVDRWFYPCDADRHCGLADLYESDAAFAANIDRNGAGLTPFLAAAIRANASRSAD